MIMIMIIYNKYYQYRYISNYCNTPRPQPVGPTELVPPHGQYPATVLTLPSHQCEIDSLGQRSGRWALPQGLWENKIGEGSRSELAKLGSGLDEIGACATRDQP